MIKVLVVDDMPNVRRAVVGLLADEEGVQVVGEAQDGEEVLAKVQVHRPDVVVMDLEMPGVDGLTATRQLLQTWGDSARIVVLTAQVARARLDEARDAGASGYVHKFDAANELGRAVRQVFEGGTYFSSRCRPHLS